MKKKFLCVLLSAALIAGMAGCGKGSGSTGSTSSAAKVANLGDDAAFGKFKDPVTVHVGQSVDPTDKTLPSGDTVENNQYTRYLKDKYNIIVKVDWTAATGNNFNQKVSLAIAGKSLPDGVVAADRTYMTKAAKSGELYDISTLFQQYASSQVLKFMENSEGRAMDNASYKGKMYSLPNITVDTDGVIVMWVRKDWLDKAGLQVPKTVSDIETAAKTFMDKKYGGDNTIGIAAPSKNTNLYCDFLASSNVIGGFDPIFAAYDSYPGYWVNDNGTVSYGTTSANTKKALETLAKWYKEGLIDPQCGTRDNVSDPINANQTGIFFGPWWAGGYGNGDSFKNDPTANWQAYPVYTDDGKWYFHMKTTGSSYTLVNKNASEDVVKAIIIMNNALVRDESTFDLSVAIGWYPLRNVMTTPDECEHTVQELTKVLKGTTKAEDYNVKNSVYKLLYSDAKKVTTVVKSKSADNLNVSDFDQTSNFGDFQRLYSILIGDRPYATVKADKKVFSVTYNQTEGMESKWANLWKLEQENMLKIVTCKADVSSFDSFVSQWKSEGGDQITKEVQELVQK